MYTSPSQISEQARAVLAEELNARLSDGLDLHSQVQFAKWNLKGPAFPSLHALYDQIASGLAERTERIARRISILGGVARGTVRQVAAQTRLPEYAEEYLRDLDTCCILMRGFDVALSGLRLSRSRAEELGDLETFDMLTDIIRNAEKYTWFLHSTLGAGKLPAEAVVEIPEAKAA